jgi:LemA protein
MSEQIVFPLFAVFICIFLLVGMYNRFIKYRNYIEAKWSDIDVALKRRHNLIPSLLELVRGYSKYETSTLESVTAQRSGNAEFGPKTSAQESEISKSLGGLIAVAENYPDLKASQNFESLQNSLNEIEQEIQNARTNYNGSVRKYNTHLESFPSNIMASIFNFSKYQYFNLELATQRELPKIEL